MLALCDEILGTAWMVFCWAYALTHLSGYLRPSPAPLWMVLLGFVVGILLGLWSIDRMGRLVRRVRHALAKRKAGMA